MQLDKYISELLLEHNCVILPSFGGFVGNYLPAKIDPIKHKFTPPYKEIGFNQNLQKNDGLLVNFISEKEDISYELAEKRLAEEVSSLKTQLDQNRTLSLANIGHFYFDKLNKIQFEPSFDFNHSLHAYGLNSFHVTPLVEETIKVEEPVVEKENKPAKEAKVISIGKTSETDTKKWKRIAAAAALLPIVVYVGWLSFATELFKGQNFSYADMNPFSKKICPNYKLRAEVAPRKVEGLKSIFDLNTENNLVKLSLFDQKEKEFDANKLIVVSLLEQSIATPVTTAVVTTNTKQKQFRYHIIAGCFGVYKNAERLASKLRKKGFSSGIIDRKNGLYRVAFQSFTNQSEAENALVGIKANHMKEAWLLEK